MGVASAAAVARSEVQFPERRPLESDPRFINPQLYGGGEMGVGVGVGVGVVLALAKVMEKKLQEHFHTNQLRFVNMGVNIKPHKGIPNTPPGLLDFRNYVAVGQNPVPLVNIKISGKWMFICPKMEP